MVSSSRRYAPGERRRGYLPLVTAVLPPVVRFASGARIDELADEDFPDVESWDEALGKAEIRDSRRASRWILYDFNSEIGMASDEADRVLADTLIGMQVAAPVGCDHFVTIFRSIEHRFSHSSITKRNALITTPCGRMEGYATISPSEVVSVVDGVLEQIAQKNIRFVNPVRLLENGLYSTNPYVRVLLWVSALDSLLMAVKADTFIVRLSKFFGESTPVFPASFDGIVPRQMSVAQMASELFELRSEIAHGRTISKKFWTPLPEIERGPYELECDGMERLVLVLEQGALLLLCRTLRKILLDGLMPVFCMEKSWRAFLKA